VVWLDAKQLHVDTFSILSAYRNGDGPEGTRAQCAGPKILT